MARVEAGDGRIAPAVDAGHRASRSLNPVPVARVSRPHPLAPCPCPCPLTLPASLAILNYMVQYTAPLDVAFAAIADPTRRGILERLGRGGDASISELAERFEMTLTGIKKHVRVLEDAGLVATEKIGRVRHCRPGPRRLEDETAWIESYRQMLESRLDSLGAFLEHTKGEEP